MKGLTKRPPEACAAARSTGAGPTDERVAPGSGSGGVATEAAAVALLAITAAAATPPGSLAAQTVSGADSTEAAAAAETVTAAEVEAHVDFLASDELRGRDTPSRGLEVAARYMATRFASLGLEPPSPDSGSGFVHRFDYRETRVDRASVEYELAEGGGVGGSGWRHGRDFLVVPPRAGTARGEVLYAGPAEAAAEGLPESAEGRVVMVTLPAQGGGVSMDAARAAAGAGAAGLLLVLAPELDADAVAQAAGSSAFPVDPGVPVFGLRHDRARTLVGASGADPGILVRSGRDPSAPRPRVLPDLTVEMTASLSSETHRPPNVAAVLPGSDPELRDRYVIFSAHLDHVGVGKPDASGDSIYNGADDNAAGVAALLELAEAFAALPHATKRSVVFFAPSGEEKGLLGSRAFVGDGPVPPESVAAVLNMDLLGRNHPDTVVAVGQSYSTLGKKVRRVAEARSELGLEVIPDPDPSQRAFFRSDHLPFAQAGVPALLFTTWLHDDYHRPSDEPEKVDPDKTSRIARLLFRTGLSVADAEEPPRWTDEGRKVLERLRTGRGSDGG